MFKRLFSKKDSIDKLALPEVDVALRLMFEVAMSDGHLDKTELELLKKRVREIAPLRNSCFKSYQNNDRSIYGICFPLPNNKKN